MSNLSKFLHTEQLFLQATRQPQVQTFYENYPISISDASCDYLFWCSEEPQFISYSHMIGSVPIVTIENWHKLAPRTKKIRKPIMNPAYADVNRLLG